MIARMPLRLAAVVPIALAAAVLAGCGSSGGGSPTTGSAVSQPGSGNSGSGNSGGGGTSVNDGIGHPVSVCTLLPAATAASISGEAITVAQEQDTPSYKIWVCNYTNAAGTGGFTISVLAMDASVGFSADIQANSSVSGAQYQSISGLGDKAFSSISGVEALFGNVSISVSNLASTTASETLIKDLQPKL
jgi:hypothetical protein